MSAAQQRQSARDPPRVIAGFSPHYSQEGLYNSDFFHMKAPLRLHTSLWDVCEFHLHHTVSSVPIQRNPRLCNLQQFHQRPDCLSCRTMIGASCRQLGVLLCLSQRAAYIIKVGGWCGGRIRRQAVANTPAGSSRGGSCCSTVPAV